MTRARAIAAVSAALPSVAAGEIFTLRDIPIDGAQVVPSVDTPGHGLANITVDTETRLVTIEGWYADLSSDVFAAHLHGGAGPGENSMAVYIVLDHTGGSAGTFSGERRLLLNQFPTFLESRTYINLHTEQFSDGEIRGQVFVPAPAAWAVLAAAALATRRRRA